MRLLVIGSGGREHALCWKLAASPLCEKIFCLPGNAGIAEIAECAPIKADDIEAILSFAKKHRIELVVVGPETPLVLGIADRLSEAGIPVFGPNAAAAQLEGSKGFMKDLAASCHIPTAKYLRTKNAGKALQFAKTLTPPLVVKTDGLAAGKGVLICQNHSEAEHTINAMLRDRQYGMAGSEIIIEEFLIGEEISYFALSDGEHILPFGSAQDHKTIGEGNKGPNTGGMGAYSPAPIATRDIEMQIIRNIIEPAIKAMKGRGTPFKGVLFAGVMVTAGGPKLLEFNVRFGDPECEALCLRLKSDLLPILMAVNDGTLKHVDVRWHEGTAITIVMSAKGYPGAYQTGTLIKNLKTAKAQPGIEIFHSGTGRNARGDLTAQGGRVLAVSALGMDIREARHLAYHAIDQIDWPEGYYRRDIGWRALPHIKDKDADNPYG